MALGACLAIMNNSFYLALDRLPIALVAAIEFVGTIGIALWALRAGRNYLAFVVAIVGVALLIDVPSLVAADGAALTSDLLGLFWAALNGSLFVLYIILGHKISDGGTSGGVERLGAAMTAAFIFATLLADAGAGQRSRDRTRNLAGHRRRALYQATRVLDG